MAIYHDCMGMVCGECGAENLETVVVWNKKDQSIRTLLSDRHLTLCPPCAVHVGASLIGDAREASVKFNRPSIEQPEHIADPSLVTKRLQQDEDVTL